MFVCWSSKGGSGTTVVSSALALLLARTGPTLLVDLCGDAPAALGCSEPAGPGVADWVRSPNSDLAALARLTESVTDGLELLPRGSGALTAPERWAELGQALRAIDATVVVDAGTGSPHPSLIGDDDHSLLVTEACYLSLRRAVVAPTRPTGVILVHEHGRALGVVDVERALGVPVVAHVPYDPLVWRSVDAGLLAARVPASLENSLAALAVHPLVDAPASGGEDE
jgi:MinD superfamily P-loop ATPase